MMAPWGATLLLDLSAGREDRLARLRAHLDATHRHRARHFAVRENLHRTVALHETRCTQRLFRHVSLHRRQLVEPDDVRLLAERIRESTLRQAARERHLTAF